MNWFWIALITPIAHAISNHFDKYLLSKYIKGGTVGALILISALFSIILLPIIFVLNPDVLTSVTLWEALILIGNGALYTVVILLYLYALDTDEASYVIPFVQFVPFFALILGYFLLGEVISLNQLFAGAFLIGGGFLLSIELSEDKGKFKTRLVGIMLAATLLYAFNSVIFKLIAVEQGFMDSLFWDMLGKVILGFILYVSVTSYRLEFKELLKRNGKKVMGLNFVNEAITLIGELALIFAILFAPVALVHSVGSLQPMFVLIIGIIITILFPKFGLEKLKWKFLIQKILGVAIITVGVYLLELVK